LRKDIQEKVNKLLEIYDESEGILLCKVKGKRHIYTKQNNVIKIQLINEIKPLHR